jgi:hypothetical protein
VAFCFDWHLRVDKMLQRGDEDMTRAKEGKGFLDAKYEDLKDALDSVSVTQSVSSCAGVAFLIIVAAGGWHLCD